MVMAMTEPKGALVDFDMAVAAQTRPDQPRPMEPWPCQCLWVQPHNVAKAEQSLPYGWVAFPPLSPCPSPINLNCNNAAAFSYKKILSRLNERYNRTAQIVGGKIVFCVVFVSLWSELETIEVVCLWASLQNWFALWAYGKVLTNFSFAAWGELLTHTQHKSNVL